MRLLRVIATVMSFGLLQCSTDPSSSGRGSTDDDGPGVGTPCTPSNEADPRFAGFHVTEETIETGAPACGSGVCLVNHFQGRVSCPFGQAEPKLCSGIGDPTCGVGSICVEAAPGYVCHTPGSCQVAGATEANKTDDGTGYKECCVPGTDKPVEEPVCGQCSPDSNRHAQNAVYCSCRCGVAEGEPDDPSFPFCDCPAGFACEEIRKYIGVGDPKLTGKYCIKQGSAFQSEQTCGAVKGYFDSTVCKGIGVGE